MEQHHKGRRSSEVVRPALDHVREALHALGRDDGPFLHHVIAVLIGEPEDMLRPTVALLAAQALGQPDDPRVIRFAVAMQIVHTASLAHRRAVDTAAGPYSDQLLVLAGDYLYAHAAVLTAGLDQLAIMALLSGTIKRICRQEVLDPDARATISASQVVAGDGGLFQLSTAGVAILLLSDDVVLEALSSYGQLLDSLWERRVADASVPQLTRRAAEALEALPASPARLALLAFVDDLHAAAGQLRSQAIVSGERQYDTGGSP